MRAVRGWVTSSEPVSLKQATRIISTFAARDNYTSQAVTSYLKRAASSFNDALLLHRDLRRSRRPADPRPEEPHTRAFPESRESGRRRRKRDGSDGKAAAGGRDKVGLFIKDDEKNSDRKGQKSMSKVDIIVSVEEGGTEKDGVDGGEEGGKKAKGKKRGNEEEQSKKKKKKKRRRSEEEERA